jgi:hypothetical protein
MLPRESRSTSLTSVGRTGVRLWLWSLGRTCATSIYVMSSLSALVRRLRDDPSRDGNFLQISEMYLCDIIYTLKSWTKFLVELLYGVSIPGRTHISTLW